MRSKAANPASNACRAACRATRLVPLDAAAARATCTVLPPFDADHGGARGRCMTGVVWAVGEHTHHADACALISAVPAPHPQV